MKALRTALPSASAEGCPVPSHVPSGAVLLALELSREARGIRGLDVLRRSVDRAPPVAACPRAPDAAGVTSPRASAARGGTPQDTTMTLHALPTAPRLAGPAPAGADAHLAQLEAARRLQLDSIPATGVDAVAMAYRASTERILDEIRVARRRLAAGLYGVCVGCEGRIDPERLELRPWTTACTGCARRSRD